MGLAGFEPAASARSRTERARPADLCNLTRHAADLSLLQLQSDLETGRGVLLLGCGLCGMLADSGGPGLPGGDRCSCS